MAERTEKKNMKRMFCIGLMALLCTGLLAGCSETADPDTVLARVNGEEIVASQVYTTLAGYVEKFGMDVESMRANKESTTYDDLKKAVLNEEVNKALVRQYAAELGLEVSAEKQAEFDKRGDEYMENVEQMIRNDVQKQAEEDSSIDVEAETKKQFEAYIEENNISKENAVAEIMQYETEQMLREHIYKSLDSSDEAVKKYFDGLVAKQQEMAEENPQRFARTQSNGETYYYYPENAVYVKSLMVDEGDRAQLEECDDAQTFELLMQEIGVDDGMKSEPYKTEGYLIVPGGDTVPVIEEAAIALTKPGEFSPVLTDGKRFVKLMLVSRPQPGPVDFESVKDSIRAQMMEEQQTEAWNTAMDERTDAADIEIIDVDY